MSGSANVGANFDGSNRWLEDDIDAMIKRELDAAMGRPTDRVGQNPNTQRVRTENEASGEKYDLSKNAYVLVLDHYKYSDSSKDRVGSKLDMDKIKDFFSLYRTEPNGGLEVHDNLTLRQVRQLMQSVRRKDFSSYSCLIFIILGQGGRKNFIQTQDGAYSIRNDIIEHVTANGTLVGKPKMFIVSATQKDAVDTDSSHAKGSNKVDTVMFESAIEAPSSTGNFFLSTFFEVLCENDTRNINEISMLISKRAIDQGQPQTPSMITTLQKRLIFADLRK